MTTAAKINALLDKFGQKQGKIDLSLDRLREFLGKIGNPHLKIPPVIHFAGTNGKGSTIAFLKAIIEADGQSCHVYTSPHLVRFNERIAINGKDIDDESLLKILQYLDLEHTKHQIELTFFELTTIAAFIAFAKFPAAFTLLETGMGGRYDATNVTEKILTIITPISIDHTEFLGDTIEKIANEKAGIIRASVPCISASQTDEVKKILTAAGKITFAEIPNDLPKLSLKGDHQKTNAAAAIFAARTLGLSKSAITRGLSQAKWNARLQQLKRGDLVNLLPKNYELWLDGAHNIAGAETLAAEIKKFDKPVYLIVGMLNNKDIKTYLTILKPAVKAIYTIPIPDAASDIAATAGIAMPDAASAIKDILKNQSSPASIFICGSLYLAGHILKSNS